MTINHDLYVQIFEELIKLANNADNPESWIKTLLVVTEDMEDDIIMEYGDNIGAYLDDVNANL